MPSRGGAQGVGERGNVNEVHDVTSQVLSLCMYTTFFFFFFLRIINSRSPSACPSWCPFARSTRRRDVFMPLVPRVDIARDVSPGRVVADSDPSGSVPDL